ncbi:response regulator [Azoarcus taiwanensis]|uniref:Response regulator n=1 Tax=Azoarcus taiwanensis TaxID=666964 RepID=A0A972FHQ7_9RHOO|nr:response regulator [Azoarcus taiwanensis]NMG02506.1 response regulator [Azoarcus taiwanensis]
MQATWAEQSLKRVLVVEDNRITQMVIEHMLKRHGLRMQLAPDGREAVRLACDGKYVLVIMDVHLPVLDGLSALKEIRGFEASSRSARMPVMVISANPTKGSVERAMRAGADAFLPKPIDKHAFDRTLSSLGVL